MSRNVSAGWLPPPPDLPLEPAHVDVWRVRLDPGVEGMDLFRQTLSEAETERTARFHFEADRDRYVLSHGALRAILGRYLGIHPVQILISADEHGKPHVSGQGLEFNLSHSGDLALIAVARERRVGIDVEAIREGISSQVIARQYFSKQEVEELDSLPAGQRKAAFFACWTRKEAYIKAQGLGLSLPLESFDVSLSPGEAARLRATRPDPEEAGRWTLLALDVHPDYQAAVAAAGTGVTFRLWDADSRQLLGDIRTP